MGANPFEIHVVCEADPLFCWKLDPCVTPGQALRGSSWLSALLSASSVNSQVSLCQAGLFVSFCFFFFLNIENSERKKNNFIEISSKFYNFFLKLLKYLNFISGKQFLSLVSVTFSLSCSLLNFFFGGACFFFPLTIL